MRHDRHHHLSQQPASAEWNELNSLPVMDLQNGRNENGTKKQVAQQAGHSRARLGAWERGSMNVAVGPCQKIRPIGSISVAAVVLPPCQVAIQQAGV